MLVQKKYAMDFELCEPLKQHFTFGYFKFKPEALDLYHTKNDTINSRRRFSNYTDSYPIRQSVYSQHHRLYLSSTDMIEERKILFYMLENNLLG